MYQSTVFVLVLAPFLAFANVLHDGPCPAPPPATPNFLVNEFTGRWLAVCSNYELVKDPQSERKCIEVNIAKVDDGIIATTYYKDPSSDNNKLEKKYVPISGQPGRYKAHKLGPSGSYVHHGWTYTIVKVHGDVVLEYACKNEGDKHKSFYRTFARSVPLSQDVAEIIKQEVVKNGDNRPMVLYNQENCDYKLTNV